MQQCGFWLVTAAESTPVEQNRFLWYWLRYEGNYLWEEKLTGTAKGIFFLWNMLINYYINNVLNWWKKQQNQVWMERFFAQSTFI